MVFGGKDGQKPTARPKCNACEGCTKRKGCFALKEQAEEEKALELDDAGIGDVVGNNFTNVMQFFQVEDKDIPGSFKRELRKNFDELDDHYRKQYVKQAAFIGKLLFRHVYGQQWEAVLVAATDHLVPRQVEVDAEKAKAVVQAIITDANDVVNTVTAHDRRKRQAKILQPLVGHFKLKELTDRGLIADKNVFTEAKKRKGTWRFGQSPQGKPRVRMTKTSEALLQRQRVAIDIIKTHLTEPLADRPIVLWDDDGNPYILGGRQRKMGKEEAWRSYLNIFERRRLENEKPLSRAQFHKVWISVKLGSRFNKTMCL